jgi:hypothetical protein
MQNNFKHFTLCKIFITLDNQIWRPLLCMVFVVHKDVHELVKFLSLSELWSAHFPTWLCQPGGINKDLAVWLDRARPHRKYVFKNDMSLTNSKNLSTWTLHSTSAFHKVPLTEICDTQQNIMLYIITVSAVMFGVVCTECRKYVRCTECYTEYNGHICDTQYTNVSIVLNVDSNIKQKIVDQGPVL